MKLFYQLDHEQQHAAIHYQIDIVLQNMLEDGIDIDPEMDDEEEIEMKEKLMSLLEQSKQFPEYSDKYDFIMDDEDANAILHNIAEDMAKTCWYANDSECVVYEGEITPEDSDEVKEDDMLAVVKDDKKMLN
jgi:hypothetical protein